MQTTEVFAVVSFCIGLIMCLIGVNTYYNNKQKDVKNDSAESAESRAKTSVKLDVICNTTNDIKSEIKSVNAQMREIIEEQIKQKMEIKSMWQRIDEIKQKID